MSKIYSTVTDDAVLASEYITAGRIVAFPTGTLYGLAANALDGYALQRLRNLKNRPDQKAFTVFLDHSIRADHIELTDAEEKMLAAMVNKPLTLLVKPKPSLEHLSDNNLVGLRVIDHPMMQKLAAAALLPMTATSANKTGAAPCSNPQCVIKEFPGLLPDSQINESNVRGASGTTYDLSLAAILDAGQLPPSQPTTIARLENTVVKIIRAGAISEAELEAVLA